MQFSVNRPTALAASGVTAKLTLTTVPSGPGAAVADPAAELVVNDAASLYEANDGNVVWSAPLVALAAGTVVDLGTTAAGLTVSAIPPGVALQMDF